MITITGKYTNANILTDNVESDAQRQILNLCNHPLFKNNQILRDGRQTSKTAIECRMQIILDFMNGYL